MSAPYPWLQRAWQGFADRVDAATLGHAYLLCGHQGMGKFAFADALARSLLCEARAHGLSACAACRSCLLHASANHPDLKLLTLEEERKSIVIDQVRELIEFFTLKSHYGRHKIGIIHPADAMNHAAANALLKILEEPPATAVLLLVASRPATLPATVASRCQRVRFELPPWPERESWVTAHQPPEAPSPLADISLAGAPLALLARVTSDRPRLYDELIAALHGAAFARPTLFESTRAFADIDVRQWLDALELVLQSLVQLRAGHRSTALRPAPAAQRQLQEIADKLHFPALLDYLDRVFAGRALVQRSSGIRGAEVIENLWFDWIRTLRTESAA